MNKRHKHYETIVAWAEGKKIQFRPCGDPKWEDQDENVAPRFYDDYEYRVKPKPDVVREYGAFDGFILSGEPMNLRLTFDGETGKLKQAEVIG